MKNNEFIAIKEAKIIFTPDGRILFLDKDTEVVNLKECTDCKQKDQRIAELESEVEQLKAKLEIWNRFNKEDYIHKGEKATERDYYYYTNGASSVLENEVEQLKKENADLKKDLQEAIDLIEENNNAFNKTFEDIKNNAVVFYEKKDKEFLELKKELEIYKKEKK